MSKKVIIPKKEWVWDDIESVFKTRMLLNRVEESAGKLIAENERDIEKFRSKEKKLKTEIAAVEKALKTATDPTLANVLRRTLRNFRVEMRSVNEAKRYAKMEKEYNKKYLVFKKKYVTWFDENPDDATDESLREERYLEMERRLVKKRPEMDFLDFECFETDDD